MKSFCGGDSAISTTARYSARLRAFATMFYASRTWGSEKSMQRLTARLLLLIALAGTFVPLALQAAGAPPRACCRRMAMHHCHAAAVADPREPIASAPCCHHNCFRGVTTSQCAQPEPPPAGVFRPEAQNHQSDFQSEIPDFEFLSTQSARAPPPFSIA